MATNIKPPFDRKPPPPKVGFPEKDYIPQIEKDTSKFDELYTQFQQADFDQLNQLIDDTSILSDRKKEDGSTLAFALLENDNSSLTELQKLKLLQKLVVKRVPINAYNKFNRTVVHIAAENSYFEILEYLKDIGCDMTKIDNNGNAPIHYIVDHMIKNRDDDKLFAKQTFEPKTVKSLEKFKNLLTLEIIDQLEKKTFSPIQVTIPFTIDVTGATSPSSDEEKKYVDDDKVHRGDALKQIKFENIKQIVQNVTKFIVHDIKKYTDEFSLSIDEIPKSKEQYEMILKQKVNSLYQNIKAKYDEYLTFDKIADYDKDPEEYKLSITKYINDEYQTIISSLDQKNKDLDKSFKELETTFNVEIIEKLIKPIFDGNSFIDNINKILSLKPPIDSVKHVKYMELFFKSETELKAFPTLSRDIHKIDTDIKKIRMLKVPSYQLFVEFPFGAYLFVYETLLNTIMTDLNELCKKLQQLFKFEVLDSLNEKINFIAQMKRSYNGISELLDEEIKKLKSSKDKNKINNLQQRKQHLDNINNKLVVEFADNLIKLPNFFTSSFYIAVKKSITILDDIFELSNKYNSLRYLATFYDPSKGTTDNFYTKLHFTKKLPINISFDRYIYPKIELTDSDNNTVYIEKDIELVIPEQTISSTTYYNKNNNKFTKGELTIIDNSNNIGKIAHADNFDDILPISIYYAKKMLETISIAMLGDIITKINLDELIKQIKNEDAKKILKESDAQTKLSVVYNILVAYLKDYIERIKMKEITKELARILCLKKLNKFISEDFIEENPKKLETLGSQSLGEMLLKLEIQQQLKNPVLSTKSIILSKDKYVQQTYIDKVTQLYKTGTINLRVVDSSGNTIIHRMIEQGNIIGIQEILKIEPKLWTYKNNNEQDALEYLDYSIQQYKGKYNPDVIEREIKLMIEVLNNLLQKIEENNKTLFKTDHNLLLYIFRMFSDCLLFYLNDFPNGWTIDDTKTLLKELGLGNEPKLCIDECGRITVDTNKNNYDDILIKKCKEMEDLTNKKKQYEEKAKSKPSEKLKHKICAVNEKIIAIDAEIKTIMAEKNKDSTKNSIDVSTISKSLKSITEDDEIDFNKYEEFIKSDVKTFLGLIKFVNTTSKPKILLLELFTNIDKPIYKKFVTSAIKPLYSDYNMLDKHQFEEHDVLFAMIIKTIQTNISSVCAYYFLYLINVLTKNNKKDIMKLLNYIQRYFDYLIIKKLDIDKENKYPDPEKYFSDTISEPLLKFTNDKDVVEKVQKYFDVVVEYFAKESYRVITDVIDDAFKISNLLDIRQYIQKNIPPQPVIQQKPPTAAETSAQLSKIFGF